MIIDSGSNNEGEDTSTNYDKMARAINRIRKEKVNVVPPDINSSKFTFVPNEENNQILFGLKGLLNLNDEVIKEIIDNRPYSSPKDFLLKVKPKKQVMISLIKAGAFDTMLDRKVCMGWYLWETCKKKDNITLQNMGALINYDIIPHTDDLIAAKSIYEFTRYLKATNKGRKDYYLVDERGQEFINSMNLYDLLKYQDNSVIIWQTVWDKIYQKYMDLIRAWIKSDKENIKQTLNELIFKDEWDKYAAGSISAWEMEAMCYYYHEHELAQVNFEKYGISNFNTLPEQPEVERSFVKGGRQINIYKLTKICGTCIAKDKSKSTVTLLTPNGVTDVKFPKEYFSMFDKQISAIGPDGKKKIVEKSWFNRGNTILVQGMRSDEQFMAKKYASTGGHTLYKISEVLDNGDIILQNERYKGGTYEED